MSARAAILWLLVALLGTANGVGAASLNAWLDRPRIAEGDTVQLTLEAPGQVSGRPDTTPLEQDFEVLGVSSGSRMSIINGRTDVRTTWTLIMSPKRSGSLTIPPLRVANYQSSALQLEVSNAPAPSGNADILIETELEPGAPYVQGQLLYTIRLLHAVPLTSGQLSKPEPANTLVQRLGEDRQYATTRNGRRYQVIERRYALFPQLSGLLKLDAPVFTGEIPDQRRRRASSFQGLFGNDPFFGRDPFGDFTTPTHRMRLRGEPAEVQVRPRPEGAAGGHWLPAERLALQGEWQPDTDALRVGEPVTLVLKLDVDGLTAGQLPSLAPDAVAGFDVFPDQAQRQTDTRDAGVTGHLVQKIALIPRQAGSLALPAVEVKWWDTQADAQRVATLPGRSLKVSPAPTESPQVALGDAASSPARDGAAEQAASAVSVPETTVKASQPPDAGSPGLWRWVSVALASGWLVSALFWWRRAHAVRSLTSEPQPLLGNSLRVSAARKQFLGACETGDAAAARRALLAWAAAHWPNNPPRGLEALSQRLPDPEARAALDDLNRALYKGGGPWNGAQLASRLRQLPKQPLITDKTEALLPPLYPAYPSSRH